MRCNGCKQPHQVDLIEVKPISAAGSCEQFHMLVSKSIYLSKHAREERRLGFLDNSSSVRPGCRAQINIKLGVSSHQGGGCLKAQHLSHNNTQYSLVIDSSCTLNKSITMHLSAKAPPRPFWNIVC